MSLNQRIQDQFQAGIHTLADAVDLLSEPVERSAQVLTDSLMHGGKILTCGCGASALAAQYVASILTDRLERERPGLAAVSLSGGYVSCRPAESIDAAFSRQVSVLGHPGDVLLAISTFGQSHAIVEAVRAAQEREMIVIALAGGDGGMLAEILREEDVFICAPADSPARIHETLLLAIHCLCDGIDYLLLGS